MVCPVKLPLAQDVCPLEVQINACYVLCEGKVKSMMVLATSNYAESYL